MSKKQGQSGNNNINAGGDYIGGDKAGGDINKSRNIRISLSFLAIAALSLGGYISIKTNWFQIITQGNSYNSSTSTNTPSPQIPPSPVSTNPFDKVSFPQEICGDELPKNNGSYPVNLYPVFVKYSESNWSSIKSKYCKDAISTTRKNGEKAIQVASFTSIDRAQLFKDFLIMKFGSSDIGESTIISENPDSVRSSSSLPISNPNRTESGFQAVSIDCPNASTIRPPSSKVSGSKVSAKFIDLEFYDCNFAGGTMNIPLKNYSQRWYELIKEDGSAELISPGNDSVLSLKIQNYIDYICANMMAGCIVPFQTSVQVKQHLQKPSRTVTINCNDEPKKIWGIKMTPRCNSTGTYIDIGSGVLNSTELRLSNGNSTIYNPKLGGEKGTVTQNGSTVTVTLTIL